MSKLKHTPGPWVIGSNKRGIIVQSSAKGFAGFMVAKCHTFDASCSQRIANACLIASAPDLLEALEGTVKALKANGYTDDQWLMAPALKAIAKAKGIDND